MYCIEVNKLTHKYFPGTPLETVALVEINLTVNRGEFLALVGASGSGKSTLVLHFNGLLQPTTGQVLVLGQDVANPKHRRRLWRRVGVVFQFPERQIFSPTVFDDVAFGPRNMGLAAQTVSTRVNEALELVDLAPEVRDMDPNGLSGGMLRRVAIAGVLAMEPEILILDEPGAGLEPRAKREILGKIKKLQAINSTTIILITHDLDDVATYADRVAVLKQGKLLLAGLTREVLSQQPDLMDTLGLAPPLAVQLHKRLARAGINLPQLPLTQAEALEALTFLFKHKQEKTGGR